MLLMSTCMVQEGRVPAEQRVLLESALKTAARDHVGSTTRLAVAWVTVPSGSGYSAGNHQPRLSCNSACPTASHRHLGRP